MLSVFSGNGITSRTTNEIIHLCTCIRKNIIQRRHPETGWILLLVFVHLSDGDKKNSESLSELITV